MEKSDIKADVVIFKTIIDGFWKVGHHNGAQNLFDEMQEKGICMIDGYCSSGRWTGCERLQRKINPNVVTFNALINAFMKEGKLFEAEELYDEMLHMGIFHNTITYTSMIDGFCKHNRLDDAKRMFDLMASKGCSPNVVTLNTLIDGCCRAKRVNDGMKLLHEMSRRGLSPDTVTYNSLIHGLCQVDDLSAAQDIVEDMISHGARPDIVTLNTLLNGVCSNGKPEKALEMLKVLDASHPLHGVEPDVQTYNIRSELYAPNRYSP